MIKRQIGIDMTCQNKCGLITSNSTYIGEHKIPTTSKKTVILSISSWGIGKSNGRTMKIKANKTKVTHEIYPAVR